MNSEIIGKMNDHFIIYKSFRDIRRICLYDNDMKMTDKNNLSFLPQKIINADFFAYKDFFYMFYQYQRRNIVYCVAAKMDANAKIVGEPKVLDTTAISFFASNKIYTLIYSENKKKIDVFKINSKNEDNYILTNSLFDDNLNLLAKTITSISMPDRNDFLTEFVVDDDGDLAFARASGTSQNNSINKLDLITKKSAESQVNFYDLNISKVYLDNIRIKADNENRHYLITSFYSKNRRGNIEGLYCSLWNKDGAALVNANYTTFSEDLRNEAKSADAGIKSAFNDYFLENIIMRKDGGYLIAAESAYSSLRGNTLSRWDYMYGSPFWTPSDYYFYSPYGYYYPWWNNSFINQSTRFFADNITVLSFDSTSKMEWANVIHKSQFDDNSDDLLGYTTLNTGSEIHFIFNQLERRLLLLTDQSITPDGQVNRKPTFKDLDNSHQFMPRYAKQVGARELIIPCQYRNYICFAKIDF
ncbi:MAG: hypothetical protein ACR2FN_07955 [Chitinophagaceae bacterium]